jgi:hypothetical protein
MRGEILNSGLQEVLFDRTPSNVLQMGSWSGQELLEHTPKAEDFYP